MHFLEWKCMNVTSDFTLKFVPMVGINNIPALVQMMAWRWPGNKPSFEPTTASLLTNIWVKSRRLGCLVTCFCYHLIAKPGNKTAAPLWPCITRPQWVFFFFFFLLGLNELRPHLSIDTSVDVILVNELFVSYYFSWLCSCNISSSFYFWQPSSKV